MLIAGATVANAAAAPLGEARVEQLDRRAGERPADLSPVVGRTVEKIEIATGLPERRVDRLRPLVTVVPGEPLRDTALRRTIHALYASGEVAQVEALTREGDRGGVVLLLALVGSVIVEEVAIEGELGLGRDRLRGELVQRAGQPLVEDRVIRGVYRVQELYASRGYFDARVRVDVEVDEARKRARVVYQIESGKRAHIGEVEFTGELAGLSRERLVDRLEAAPGDRYREATVREDANRLRSLYRSERYLAAEVELAEERRSEDAASVDLVYHIEPGPRVVVEVRGASREKLESRRLLPFLEEEGYDEALLLQTAERIERFYQERGHYLVDAEVTEERRDGELLVLVEVERGPQFTLERVEFRGNEHVDDERLRELMSTSPQRFLVPGSGRLVEEVLESDLDNIRSYYALQGWTRAEVGPPEIERLGDHRLALTIPIEEGPRSRAVELEVEGNEALSDGDLLSDLPLEPGGPYHPRRQREAVDRILSRYELSGYPDARVTATTDWNAEHTLVDVTFEVLEGERQVAGNLIVRGNERTRSEVIRVFAGLEKGEPLSYRRLLEIQRNLYRLGVFSRVEVELASTPEGSGVRDVVVRVTEGRNQRVAYGVGYDTEERFGGLVGYSHANLLGRAIQIQVDLRATERSERYRLLVRQPYWGGRWPGSVSALLFDEFERRPTFGADQQGLQLELARVRADGDLRLSLFFDYRQVELEEGTDLSSLDELPVDERRAFAPVKVASVTPRAVLDRRDDPLDPHDGFLASAQVQYARPVGDLAEAHFTKVFGQLASFWELPGGVIGTSLRGGRIEPLDEGRPIPFSERFFSGGRTTHRAYERDALGIVGETIQREMDGDLLPLGGNALALLNVDYRFPIAGAFGGTLFVDGGNVWADFEDVTLEELKWGAGVGGRYLSPIGPVRLDVGWKLDRIEGESPYEIFISFGNTF